MLLVWKFSISFLLLGTPGVQKEDDTLLSSVRFSVKYFHTVLHFVWVDIFWLCFYHMIDVSRLSVIDKQETKVSVQRSTQIPLLSYLANNTINLYRQWSNTNTNWYEKCLYRYQYNTVPIIGGTLSKTKNQLKHCLLVMYRKLQYSGWGLMQTTILGFPSYYIGRLSYCTFHILLIRLL